jgi:hypothetical protein
LEIILLSSKHFFFTFISILDVWPYYAHFLRLAVIHENSGVLHHFGVLGDCCEFPGGLPLVVLVRGVPHFVRVCRSIVHTLLPVKLIMHSALLSKGIQCQRSLVQFLFFVRNNFVVVGQTI